MTRQVILSPDADHAFKNQLQYLIDRHALVAARALKERVISYLQTALAVYPYSGRETPRANLWESWVPRSKIIVWYTFDEHELRVIRIWHAARCREPDPRS